MRHLVDDIVALMRFRADEKAVRFTVEVDPAVPAVVKGDAGKLSQVLLNLIGNALKFTDRGAVDLSVSPAPVYGPGQDLALRFEVRDSGIGIAPADQARLFEAFYRGARAKSGRHDGSGLGLAICKKLVSAMGGRDRPGKRARRGQPLLVHRGAARGRRSRGRSRSQDVALPTGQPDLGERTVLLVEDNEVNAIVVRTFLERMGHKVTSVDSGEEAVAAVATPRVYDVVVMDISLPGIDGVEATRQHSRPGRPGAARHADHRHVGPRVPKARSPSTWPPAWTLSSASRSRPSVWPRRWPRCCKQGHRGHPGAPGPESCPTGPTS